MTEFNYEEGPPESGHGKVPMWLILTYVFLPIWGIVAFFLFWNGNTGGYFDRGYWGQLQRAANTTYPFVNHNETANRKE